MTRVYNKAHFGEGVVPFEEAHLSIASSAVLYGLSVYTVFPVSVTPLGMAAFRLRDHFLRLVQSARIIGIDAFEEEWDVPRFENSVRELVAQNDIREDIFVRATVHVNERVSGTRSRGLKTLVSIFLYEAAPIVPQNGVRLKTSVWRRVPDFAIPSRAKVNGAYVNSVLGKQDAIDSGYDDCIFLDMAGHVCELSAANVFLVRGGTLITPSVTSDILEGITRRTILEIARSMSIAVEERTVDLTELYVADEVFASGTSSFIAPVKEIDKRIIGSGSEGPITTRFRDLYQKILHGEESSLSHLLTAL